ncbi:hypothetical protein [Ohtaekwangia sp.]|uniref:hypothetical protein n=1 Tax=Ohtaekwangia sp. TaxID=2066019 RepID=UPI002FDE2B36
MVLAVLYAVILVGIIISSFFTNSWADRYERNLIAGHCISGLIFFLDACLVAIADTSLRTAWIDHFIGMVFLLTGAMIFAFYRRKLPLISKIYFGAYIYYPLIVPLAVLADRIFALLVAAPLLAVLLYPQVYYDDNHFSLRSSNGMAIGVTLVRKGLFTETAIGEHRERIINDEEILSDLEVVTQNSDSIVISVKVNGQPKEVVFSKRHF